MKSIIQFIEQYKNLGYIPEAIFNFLALLGWSPGGEEEIFTKQDFYKIFDANRLSKSSSKFDVGKLEWINSVYMKKITDKDYLDLVIKYATEEYVDIDFTKEENQQKLLLYKNEIKAGSDIKNKISLFFNNEFTLDSQAKEFINSNPSHKKVIDEFMFEIKDINWSVEEISQAISNVKEKLKVKGKNLFMPIRIGTTGQMHGPETKTKQYIY